MIVLDASAAVDLLLSLPRGKAVGEHLRGHKVIAPSHFDVEVVNAIRRLTSRGYISEHEGEEAIETLSRLPIERWQAHKFNSNAFRLRNSVSMSDAYYVILAEAVNAPLLTTDGRLARTTGHSAKVIFPSE